MARVFEMVAFCSDLRAEAATERGAALALQGQLVEARRCRGVPSSRRLALGVPRRSGRPGVRARYADELYAAALKSGILPAAGAACGGPDAVVGAVGAPSRPMHNHVAFLTPTSQTDAPARDVVRLLKTNIDPASKDIKDVSLRLTRNLDHARLATQNLCERMRQCEVPLAAISDPYRPCGKVAQLPLGYQKFAVENDPAAMIIAHRPQLDICPLVLAKLVVTVYCEARDLKFTFISAYAPPHRSMDATLEEIEWAMALSRTRNVIVAGDFNAKHPLWGPCAGDERGTRLLEFMAANRLIMLNDPQSQPTYETKYAASWIDITMVTHSVVAAGLQLGCEGRFDLFGAPKH
ncbi:hypothetical protein HPB49_017595 [Dermacentor silvarum]|uniref:Uncharacterized protein n=1 Tax=Dermacentor silvarum TaxID=543639 RepID=A0ACB8DK57_DERSI|nr:hypothetical protein HPB49_017595 [Dermacentor silvarum]